MADRTSRICVVLSAIGLSLTAGFVGLAGSTGDAVAATPVHLGAFPLDGKCGYEDSWQAPRGTSSAGVKLYHEGLDLIAATGVPIKAVVDGTVTKMNNSTRGGNQLYLVAADGSYFFHAHISKYADGLVVGQVVKAGTVIAYVGQTGDAQYSVPHLHFEVHPAWNAKNPINPFPVVRELSGCGYVGTGQLASLPDSVASTIAPSPALPVTAGVTASTVPADTPMKRSNGFDGMGAVKPNRVADSRSSFSLTSFTPGTVNYLTIAGHGGVPANATAVIVNMTVTNPNAAGWLRAWPCGQAIPDTSNLNYTDGQTIANGALLALGEKGRLCFQATTKLDLIVDVMGWQGAGGSLGFISTGPQRLFDSRSIGAKVPVEGAQVVRVAIPGAAPKAASLNVTAVAPAEAGHVTIWPCDQAHPVTSSLNFAADEIIANAVTVAVSAKGEVCIDASTSTHLLVDLAGSWVESAGARPLPVTPSRLLDTRSTPKPAPGKVQKVTVVGVGGVPADATAAQVNLTVTGPKGAGFVTAWPCGKAQPNVSNVNYSDGQTVANSATVPLGGGQLCVAASSAADIIVDVTGYLK
jgi:Peptidase family M23